MLSFTFLVAGFNFFLAVIMLIQNWRLNKNILFFSFYLMIISFTSILYDTIINGGSAHLLMLMIGNAGPLFFLIGPLFYFFIRGLVKEHNDYTDKDLIHLMPFFLNMLILIPYLFKSVEFKLAIAENSLQNLSYYMNTILVVFPTWFSNLVRTASMIFYIVWAMIILRQAYQERINKISGAIKKQYISNYKWLNLIAIASLILVVMHIGLTLYTRIDTDPVFVGKLDDDNLFLISVICNSLFPLLILFNPGILFGLPTNQVLNPIIKTKKLDPSVHHGYGTLEAADKVNTYNEYFDGLSESIMAYFEKNKPFLDHDFTSNDLSNTFEVPQHHIHFCIKYYVGKSFNAMIAEFRIKHAIELLKSKKTFNQDTIQSVGHDSGFNSYADFVKNFKKVEGKKLDQWLSENT
ncbi:MAG: helix-turn-helix domain-containing protein [Paludibacter sp.]|nr:helix-turn-helix domain-containing protein [Paludibacter sp.]